MPVGLGSLVSLGTRMTLVGVTMMSTGTSCFIIGFPSGGKFSSMTWQSWMVVMTGVFSVIMPSCRIMPYSSSAKPSPLPTRAPLTGLTAEEPTTTTSILVSSSSPSGSASCFMPPAVAAKLNFEEGTLPGRMREKKPVLRRGCGTYRILSACNTATRTDFCGVSGFTFTTCAVRNSGSSDKRLPASADPLKLGILWCTGRGKSAISLSSR
mmetsp:Transcript_89007/g.229625  ORF Transcript_89007/g.229625 Transcript_89007/m.229625 type:complete len:210 (-) Transcript_89007:563-1192(-)